MGNQPSSAAAEQQGAAAPDAAPPAPAPPAPPAPAPPAAAAAEDKETRGPIERDNALIYSNTLLKTTEQRCTFAAEVPTTTRAEVEGVPSAFLLHDVLTADECAQWVAIAEAMGFGEAPVSTGINSAQMMPDLRDNERVMWDAPAESQVAPMAARVLALLPERVVAGNGTVWRIKRDCCLNERFRFYRYAKEQRFGAHFDGCFRRSNDEMSHFTFIIYLNEGFDGGYTTFFPGGKNSLWTQRVQTVERRVNPRRGAALVFPHTGGHSPLHEGSPHFSDGQFKYVLRSDVMYVRETATAASG